MNEKPVVVIQTGHMRTGTTLLVNLLYGFISPHEKIHCLWETHHDIQVFHTKCNIYKSHCLNIDEFMRHNQEKYNVFFVCTERDDKKIDEKYRNMRNVLLFDYNEILETDSYTTDQIIENTYNKLRAFLPETISLDKETCITRIENMNETYKEIENKDFSHVDDFFQLHGKHRNRDT
mgnify:FL=1